MGGVERIDFFLDILKDIAVLGMLGYVTAQLPLFRRTLGHEGPGTKDKLFLALVFGCFSVLGNYLSIPIFFGSLANHRIVGAIVGGLFGGPWVGLGAGAIGAINRYFMGGFTMEAAVISNVLIGLISGLVGRHYGPRQINLKVAMATAFVSEMILKSMVLLISKPFSAALELERIIALPTIVTNVLGTGLFVYVIHDLYADQEKAQIKAAHQIMSVLRKTQGILNGGLNEITARRVAETIYQHTLSDAVALTDTERVLAFVGVEANHHRAGQAIAIATCRAIIAGKPVHDARQGIGCRHPDCSLRAVLIVPLIVDKKVIGTLKLFKTGAAEFSSAEAELIQGMADVLSLQLMQAKLNEQSALLGQAEFNVLKAQVHPHFLFNTLGTIRSLTRTNVTRARQAINDLAGFLRKSLRREREFVALAEELDTVHMYLRLEQLRYGERIKLEEHVPGELLQQMIPIFSLQPLVENAIQHGLSCKKGGGTITIAAREQNGVFELLVSDDGIGIAEEKLAGLLQKGASSQSGTGAGIGVKNIHFRLQHFYGSPYGLTVRSREQEGTEILMRLPAFSTGRSEIGSGSGGAL